MHWQIFDRRGGARNNSRYLNEHHHGRRHGLLQYWGIRSLQCVAFYAQFEEGYTKKGLVRAQGREELARAARGGTGCKSFGWNGWSHLMVNHVITPTRIFT